MCIEAAGDTENTSFNRSIGTHGLGVLAVQL